MRTQLDAARRELATQAPELEHYRAREAAKAKVAEDLKQTHAAIVAKLLAMQALEVSKSQADSEEAGSAFIGAAGGAAGGSADGPVHAPWETAPAAAQGAAPAAAPGAAEIALEADDVDVAVHGIMDPNLGGEGGMLLGVEGWDGALR